MSGIAFAAAYSLLAVLCSGCSAPPAAGEDAEPDLTLTLPDLQSARFAAQDAISDLPGVRAIASSYSEPARLLVVWVHYEPVPDRWPIHQQIEQAVQGAGERYVAYRNSTVTIELVDYDLGQSEIPSG